MQFSVGSGSGSAGTYQPVPVGRYKARVLHVIFVGTVPGYQGAMKGEVQVGFELDYRGASGKTSILYKRYGASMHAMAKLRQLIEMLESRTLSNAEAMSYDVSNLAGKQVWVQVGNKAGDQRPDGTVPVYDRIDGIYPSMEQFSTDRPTLTWDVRKDSLEALPERIQKRVMESTEWQAKHGNQVAPPQYAFGQQVNGSAVYQQPQPAPAQQPAPQPAPAAQQHNFGF